MNYQLAAQQLDVDVPAVVAIATVESRGAGFLSTGEPVILYERHVMYRLLKQKGIDTQPLPNDLVSPTAGGYGKYSEQHAKLQRACKIDRECALQSCSWGTFQIMGYHWKGLGYPSLQAFINAMYKDEQSHLDCFVRFILSSPRLHEALEAHDWQQVAYLYNGPAYAKNQYDKKLEAAYVQAGGK